MGQVQTKERVEDQGIMLRVRDGTSPVQGKSRGQGIMLRVRDGTSPDQGKSRRLQHHAKSERWDKSSPRKE